MRGYRKELSGDAGAYFQFFILPEYSRSLMKWPPTTVRCWKPLCCEVTVKYQSVAGTRERVLL